MNFNKKRVTRMPMEKLWHKNGYFKHTRKCYLTPDDVCSKISKGGVTFFIASIGSLPELLTVKSDDSYWLNTIKPHLADPEGFYLDDFPNSFAFVSSEWTTEDSTIILLEMHH